MKNILLIAAFALSLTAFGQYTRGGGGAFTIGMQTMPVEDLKIFAPDMAPLPSTSLTFGGYGYIQLNRFTIGMKGGGYVGSESRDAEYVYSFGGGSFLVDFGYKIVGTDKTSIYPVLGVGFYGAGFQAAHLGTVNIQNVDLPYGNTSSFNIQNVLFDVGVRMEQLVTFRSSEQCGKGGMMVGIEAGYQYALPTDYWKGSCGCAVYGVPEFSFQGFYARILIGGFGGM